MRYRRTWQFPISRRRFLGGLSVAAGLLAGCSAPRSDDFVPYVEQPEDIVAGRKLYVATTLSLAGYGRGAIATTHEGRPTNIQGNPAHPASLGASDVWMQAAVFDLYDPDRAQLVYERDDPSTWQEFYEFARADLERHRTAGGARLRILTGTVTSPSLARQIASLLEAFPAARWHAFEPLNPDFALAGAQMAFGKLVDTTYRFDRADVVVALDSDFLLTCPGSLRYARDFIGRRRLTARRGAAATGAMNRLYAVETYPTIVGATADHRLALRPSEVEAFARALATAVGVPAVPPSEGPSISPAWIDAVSADLLAHRGAGIVLAGREQPPVVHALAHAMNVWLQNVGSTVLHTAPVAAGPTDQRASLAQLTSDMHAGQVDTLYILGTNPVYATPAALRFAQALAQVPTTVRLGLSDDETTAACRWKLPMSHELESWGDLRAFDGTVSIVQPTIERLYDTRSALELVASLASGEDLQGESLVRDYWRGSASSPDFARFWETTLREGVMAGTAAPEAVVRLRSNLAFLGPGAPPSGPLALSRGQASGIELVIRPDPAILDGQYANDGWLQELPKPLSKIVWDNAVFVSPRTAVALGIEHALDNLPGNEDLGPIENQLQGREVLEVSTRAGAIELPVYVMAGLADGCAAVHLGYGRTRAGRYGTGRGASAYLLLPAGFPGSVSAAELASTRKQAYLALGQHAATMHGRKDARSGTLAQYRAEPAFAKAPADTTRPPDLYPPPRQDTYQWAMAIDLQSCIGCNACVVACQSENNSPVVGYEEMLAFHDMHWIRVDRYFRGSDADPEIVFQPILCMQCEHAPCEVVCPVEATVHSSEGLSDMVYNRCIGTRYCSNNCPYKVRRFNFLQYSDYDTPVVQLRYNPEVTVRSRGVMEKCTYCVQRINDSRMRAQEQRRAIRDGEVVPACAQACPAEAIVMGNLNDPQSLVSQLRKSPLEYALLGELDTRPRTTFLARVRNPNLALAHPPIP